MAGIEWFAWKTVWKKSTYAPLIARLAPGLDTATKCDRKPANTTPAAHGGVMTDKPSWTRTLTTECMFTSRFFSKVSKIISSSWGELHVFLYYWCEGCSYVLLRKKCPEPFQKKVLMSLTTSWTWACKKRGFRWLNRRFSNILFYYDCYPSLLQSPIQFLC